MGWLLATPNGKKTGGFTLVRHGVRTSLEVTDASYLVELVIDTLTVADLTSVGWRKASVLSLRSKVHAADINLGDTTTTGATTS